MENIPYPQCIHSNVWLVPCMLQSDSKTFVPLFKPYSHIPCFDSQLRNPWHELEDKILKSLVDKHGLKHWKRISLELNKAIYKGITIRNSKQCRERWINHIDPKLNKADFTEAEDLFILEHQFAIGNKWSEIARGINGRTENAVKNRWKCLATKAKKLYKNSVNPIADYIRTKKDGGNSDNWGNSISPNNGFFPMCPFSEIAFSSIADRFRAVEVHTRTPTMQDISPSSLLFFNS